jgi:hypothetical protein
MRTFLSIASLVLFSFLFFTCSTPSEWTELFNGKNLENWDMYNGGADVSLESLFSVTELEGVPVMHISGEINAAIGTKEEFENYHLRMEFKWGEEVYTRRNSGLLYHGYGPYGNGLDIWKNSHELQLMTGNLGDSYRMGDTYCEIPAVEQDSAYYVYSKGAEPLPIGKEGVSKIARKSKDLEKPIGEWNVVDLYCFGDQAVHVVNGETVLVNYKSGKYEDGEVTPLTSGNIQLQSEGAELFIKNMKLKPISAIPAEIL